MQPNQQQPPQQTPPLPTQTYEQYQQQQYQAEQESLLATAVSHAQEGLYEATSVFPFELFPDTITIDREKVTIIRRSFFRTGEVQSLRIEDILNVTANVGPFFGSVHITLRFLDRHQPEEVKYLSRRDALQFQRIAQGYAIARQQGIDCDTMPRERLVGMLLTLGQGAGQSVRP